MSDTNAPKSSPSVVQLSEVSVCDLLSMDGLIIPKYQRPYMWGKKNVYELFLDLDTVIEKTKNNSNSNFVYRLGSVILTEKTKEEKNRYEIVDGQQRITTLFLIIKCLSDLRTNQFKNTKIINSTQIEKINSCTVEFIKKQFDVSAVCKKHLSENYKYIKSKLSDADVTYITSLLELLSNNVKFMKFVVIGDDADSIAFQLFDSQNSRGKELYPHDLLKAHHLREINQESYEKNYAESFVEEEISPELSYAERWDSLSSDKSLSLSELFNVYLFRIKKWINNESANLIFTKDHIDEFKGIPINSSYRFAKREFKASPYYQLGVPCCSGSDFFEMIFYYHSILKGIINSFESIPATALSLKSDSNGNNTENVYSLVNKYKYYDTFLYTKNLFYTTLLLYYDRFSQLDQKAIDTIFAWSVYPRVNQDLLNFSAIDHHAIENDSLIKIITSSLNHLNVIENFYIYKKNLTQINLDNAYYVKEIREQIKSLFCEEKNGY